MNHVKQSLIFSVVLLFNSSIQSSTPCLNYLCLFHKKMDQATIAATFTTANPAATAISLPQLFCLSPLLQPSLYHRSMRQPLPWPTKPLEPFPHPTHAQITAAYSHLSGISSTSSKPSSPHSLKSGVSGDSLNNPPNMPSNQPLLGLMHQTQAHIIPCASLRNSLMMQKPSTTLPMS